MYITSNGHNNEGNGASSLRVQRYANSKRSDPLGCIVTGPLAFICIKVKGVCC